MGERTVLGVVGTLPQTSLSCSAMRRPAEPDDVLGLIGPGVGISMPGGIPRERVVPAARELVDGAAVGTAERVRDVREEPCIGGTATGTCCSASGWGWDSSREGALEVCLEY